MCIIAYKPKGQEVDYRDLSDQWDTNPDGAGLAYFDKGRLVVDKGHMNKDTFFAALAGLKGFDVVYHLRLATHGLTNRHQTHPFVVSPKPHNAKALKPKGKQCIFHNGVITGLGDNLISDTIDFIASVVARIPDNAGRIKALSAVSGSRFAYLADGEIYLVGNFTTRNGLKYSNMNWTFNYPAYTRKGKGSYIYWETEDCGYWDDDAPELRVVDVCDPCDSEDLLLDEYSHCIETGGSDND